MNINSSNIKGLNDFISVKSTKFDRNNPLTTYNKVQGTELKEEIQSIVVSEESDEMKLYNSYSAKYSEEFNSLNEDGSFDGVGIDEILGKHASLLDEIENSEDDDKTKEIKKSALNDRASWQISLYSIYTTTSANKAFSAQYVENKDLYKNNPNQYQTLKETTRARTKIAKSNLMDIVNDYLKNGVSTLQNNNKINKFNAFILDSNKLNNEGYDNELLTFNDEEYALKKNDFNEKLGFSGGCMIGKNYVAFKYGATKVESDANKNLTTIKDSIDFDGNKSVNTYA